MKEFKGTQGEWEAVFPEKSNGYWYVNSPNNDIGGVATCYNILKDEAVEFNAKLIASAPDLLRALQSVYSGMTAENYSEKQFDDVEKAINKALN